MPGIRPNCLAIAVTLGGEYISTTCGQMSLSVSIAWMHFASSVFHLTFVLTLGLPIEDL